MGFNYKNELKPVVIIHLGTRGGKMLEDLIEVPLSTLDCTTCHSSADWSTTCESEKQQKWKNESERSEKGNKFNERVSFFIIIIN